VDGAATDGAAADGAGVAPLEHADTTIAATANGMASRKLVRCVVKSDLLKSRGTDRFPDWRRPSLGDRRDLISS